MVTFDPMDDKEAEASKTGLFDPGVYRFVVAEADETVSSSGNDMIVAKLEFETTTGIRTVYDYLLISGRMAWKLKGFCESIGWTEQYASGSFEASDMVGLMGEASIGIQEANNGYPAKNVVEDYIKEGSEVATKPSKKSEGKKKKPKKADEVTEDDIPF